MNVLEFWPEFKEKAVNCIKDITGYLSIPERQYILLNYVKLLTILIVQC